MKVLITGGCGFIGTNAATAFHREGHEVVAADDFSREGSRANAERLMREGIRVFPLDVTDLDAVGDRLRRHPDVDAILHCAAQTAVTTSLADPASDFAVNAGGTLNVLEAVREFTPAAAVVLLSTNKVYGSLDGPGYWMRPIGEDRPLDPCTPYGCSKAAADCYVRDYARTYGLRTVVLRCSCIYGPMQNGTSDQGWISWLMRAALAGRPITIYGDGEQVRDCLHVDDLVDVVGKAVERAGYPEVSGSAFNVGGGVGNTLSVDWLLWWLGAQLGREVPRAYAAARPGDQRSYISDTSRAARLLGWRPTCPVATRGLSALLDETRRRVEAGG